MECGEADVDERVPRKETAVGLCCPRMYGKEKAQG